MLAPLLVIIAAAVAPLELVPQMGHADQARALTFNRDGSRLLSVSGG